MNLKKNLLGSDCKKDKGETLPIQCGSDYNEVGEWNKFRIEEIDTPIKTWIDGTTITTTSADMTTKDVIDLYANKANKLKPLQVCWRNILIDEK